MSDQTWTKAKRSEISRNEKVQHFFSIWSYLSEPAARHAMQRGSYWTVECRQAMFFSENGTKRSNFSALCPAMGVPLLLLIHFVQSFCENPTSSPPPKGQRLANLMLQIQQKSNKKKHDFLSLNHELEVSYLLWEKKHPETSKKKSRIRHQEKGIINGHQKGFFFWRIFPTS